MQGLEEGFGAGGTLVGFNGHKHPACGPVDGDEQVAPLALVLHLGQVLHIHVQETRLVALEGFVGLLGCGGLQGVQVAHTMAAHAPVKSRARDIGTQELSRHRQQIIERQQQCAAQMHDRCFLCMSQDGLQAVRCVRAVTKLLAGSDLSTHR